MKTIVLFIAIVHAVFAQGTSTLIDFETFPNGEQVPYLTASLSNQWESLGILLENGLPQYGASAYAGVAGLPPHSGTHGVSSAPQNVPGISLHFSFVELGTASPGMVTNASLWIENNDTRNSTVTFFGADNSALYTTQTLGHDYFAAYSNPNGIAGIRIDDADYFLADDLRFSPVMAVPEPRVWALLGIGLLACAVFVRRKN